MRTIAVSSAGLRSAWAFVAFAGAAHCAAAALDVAVVDERGKPIENVAVYARAAHAGAEQGATGAAAASFAPLPPVTMDQQNLQFVPHVLVVQAGTEVLFPNSDNVSHHVYSFSPAKTFELGLYKGDRYPPVVFDRAGIVVLGCNIHDSMLGYVVVVNTPHFALTNEHGIARIDGVPDAEYVVEVWTPRVRPAGLPAAQRVAVTNGDGTIEFRIAGRLAPPHDHGTSSLTWERY